MTTGYVWHDRYVWHNTGTSFGSAPPWSGVQPYSHFESPESKARFNSLVRVSGLIDSLKQIPARYATKEDLLRVHSEEYVDSIKARSDNGGSDGTLDGTPFGAGSYEIASLAAGGTIAATEAVLTGAVDNAYALVRPPGHHAVRDSALGFCIFGNVAIAIEWARAVHGVERVAVVDWDVHHGNGTQSMFEADPDVLNISFHQDRLFPYDSGLITEIGIGAGEGSVINVPLPAGSGDGAYIKALSDVAAPAIRAFTPDIILVSSGFDASALDPLGRMAVTSHGYRNMTEQLRDVAADVCGGRLVMSHEGGYSPVYVPYCGLAVLEALSGVSTGVADPVVSALAAPSPTARVTAPQKAVIDEAAALARRLRLTVGD